MTPDALLYHLLALGARVELTADLRSLEVDAPDGTLTPEMVGLVAEHKGALVDLLFGLRERAAIEDEGRLDYDPTLPDVIRYPVGLHKIGDYRACLDGQRVGAAPARRRGRGDEEGW